MPISLTVRLSMYLSMFVLIALRACQSILLLVDSEMLGSFFQGDRASPGASPYLPKAPVTLLTMTAGNASIQLGVDPRLRGRVMALYIMLLMGGTPIGAPILGWLGEAMGPRWTLIGGGAVTVLGVLASVLMLRGRLRSGES